MKDSFTFQLSDIMAAVQNGHHRPSCSSPSDESDDGRHNDGGNNGGDTLTRNGNGNHNTDTLTNNERMERPPREGY